MDIILLIKIVQNRDFWKYLSKINKNLFRLKYEKSVLILIFSLAIDKFLIFFITTNIIFLIFPLSIKINFLITIKKIDLKINISNIVIILKLQINNLWKLPKFIKTSLYFIDYSFC